MPLDRLPPDLLRMLVYASGLHRLEDRLSLLLSCRTVLDACGGVHARTGRIATDGGEAHWGREMEAAGYSGRRTHAQHGHGHRQRSLFFERKALRCACCNVRITHITGRISTTTGIHGRGIHLSSCIRCGPLVLTTTPGDAVHRVFGCYATRRRLEQAEERSVAAASQEREKGRANLVRVALGTTGMSAIRIERALVGSASFIAHITSVDGYGPGLLRTVANICRRHWMNFYTWLPCAICICGKRNASMVELYGVVLECYGGYPSRWPWSVDAEMDTEREHLAVTMVNFYADNMMLDALFQRLIKEELDWDEDVSWLARIRDAVIRTTGGVRGGVTGHRRRVTFVTKPPTLRSFHLAHEAEYVGGYQIRRSLWHVTFCVQ